jgi:DNA-binding Lrp family transcriptional regulator
LKFDDTDIKIIRNLQRDARTNFADIAKERDLSVDTIIKRFHRLQKNGVIKGTTILLDPRLFGFYNLASLEVSVEPIHLTSVVEKIQAQPGVVFCTPSMGMQNVFTITVLHDMRELNILGETIKNIPHVREVKTSIWVGDVLLCPENFELVGLKEGKSR